MTADPLWLDDDLLAVATPEELARYRDLLAAELAALPDAVKPLPNSPGELAAALGNGYDLPSPHLNEIDVQYVESAAAVRRGEGRRTLILMPPRHGKTRRTRWGNLWWLTQFPDDWVVSASYSARLAASKGRWVRDMIRVHHADLGIALAPGHEGGTDFGLVGRQGGMRTTGAKGTLTGFGGGLIDVDDPHKDRAEVESPVWRNLRWEWWQSTVIPRIEGAVIVTMQRWHPDDLAGRLLAEEGRVEEGGLWHVVELPALSREGERDPETGRSISDRLGRAHGEPLFPALWPARKIELEVRATMGEHYFQAQYQQNPHLRTGGLWTYDDIRRNRVKDAPDLGVRVVAVDPSGGDRDGSDEAGIVAAGLGVADRHVYVTHDVSAVLDVEEWPRRALILALTTQAGTLVAERNMGGMVEGLVNAAWRVLVEDLRTVETAVDLADAQGVDVPAPLRRADGQEVPDLLDLLGLVRAKRRGEASLVKPSVVTVPAKVNKILRAEPVAQMSRQGRHHLVGLFSQMEHEMTTYTLGSSRSPNRLDAMVYASTFLEDPSAVGELTVARPAFRVPRGSVGGRRPGGVVRRGL